MSVYASLNCGCEEPKVDVALDMISQKVLRICCLNCERETYVAITKKQFDIIFGYRKR